MNERVLFLNELGRKEARKIAEFLEEKTDMWVDVIEQNPETRALKFIIGNGVNSDIKAIYDYTIAGVIAASIHTAEIADEEKDSSGDYERKKNDDSITMASALANSVFCGNADGKITVSNFGNKLRIAGMIGAEAILEDNRISHKTTISLIQYAAVEDVIDELDKTNIDPIDFQWACMRLMAMDGLCIMENYRPHYDRIGVMQVTRNAVSMTLEECETKEDHREVKRLLLNELKAVLDNRKYDPITLIGNLSIIRRRLQDRKKEAIRRAMKKASTDNAAATDSGRRDGEGMELQEVPVELTEADEIAGEESAR